MPTFGLIWNRQETERQSSWFGLRLSVSTPKGKCPNFHVFLREQRNNGKPREDLHVDSLTVWNQKFTDEEALGKSWTAWTKTFAILIWQISKFALFENVFGPILLLCASCVRVTISHSENIFEKINEAQVFEKVLFVFQVWTHTNVQCVKVSGVSHYTLKVKS